MIMATGLAVDSRQCCFWHLQVSVINMIMATGLAVDYSVYLAQKFMTTTGEGVHAAAAAPR
jgi:hypothetical protein